MSLSVVTLATAEQLRELPMPSWAYGALFFLGFLILLGVLWSFRHTANKIADRDHHSAQGQRH